MQNIPYIYIMELETIQCNVILEHTVYSELHSILINSFNRVLICDRQMDRDETDYFMVRYVPTADRTANALLLKQF